jgi:hypothetical protein
VTNPQQDTPRDIEWLSEKLGKPLRTVRYWAKKGVIPGTIKIGKGYLFCEKDVNEFIRCLPFLPNLTSYDPLRTLVLWVLWEKIPQKDQCDVISGMVRRISVNAGAKNVLVDDPSPRPKQYNRPEMRGQPPHNI